jgi:membrane protein implicated in regulation of membrane protease activity
MRFWLTFALCLIGLHLAVGGVLYAIFGSDIGYFLVKVFFLPLAELPAAIVAFVIASVLTSKGS